MPSRISYQKIFTTKITFTVESDVPLTNVSPSLAIDAINQAIASSMLEKPLGLGDPVGPEMKLVGYEVSPYYPESDEDVVVRIEAKLDHILSEVVK